MEVHFKEKALEELYFTGKTKDSKYKKLCKDQRLVRGYIKAVKILYDAPTISKLATISYLHYEKLKYQKTPRSSIRIVNGQIERLIFTENLNGVEIELLEINQTHYDNKK